ncbi:unnamed protein product [Symbiodinium sp. CCMP2592]|nr:unnamed protein product [Symbiodinium sp. CCMP2592]
MTPLLRSRRQLRVAEASVLAVSLALLAIALGASGSNNMKVTFLAGQAKALQRAHGQLEAAAAMLGPPRKVTLKEFLLDPTFEPPTVEYAVAENDGVHRARVAFAGVSHTGGGKALRSLRAKQRVNEKKHAHQETIFRVPRGRNLRATTMGVAGGKHESNLKWIEHNSGAQVSLLGGPGTGKPLSVKVSGETGSCEMAGAMVRDLLEMLPANAQTGHQPRRKSPRGFAPQ